MNLVLILDSLHFIDYCAEKSVLYQIISFDDFSHLICAENETYVDIFSGFSSTPKLPQKSNASVRSGSFSRQTLRKPGALQVTLTILFFYERHTSVIFEKPYICWNMDRAAHLSLNHIPDRELMTKQYPRTSTHQSKTEF